MFLDRIKTVTAVRAAKITGINRQAIAKAMDQWTESHGRIGLAFVVDSERRRIRLCALDDWMSRKEQESRFAS